MKKKLFSLLALTAGLLLATNQAKADGELRLDAEAHHGKKDEHTEHKHDSQFWAGGSLTLWKDKVADEMTISVRPEFGRFISEHWGIGLMANYTSEGGESRTYGFSPFVRRYVFEKKPFNIYFDAGIGLSWSQSKLKDMWSKSQMGYEIGVRPGACLDLAKGLCLCLRMGFVGYRDKFTSAEEHEITPSGWGVRFAPEELMIGLELEF